MSHVSHDESPDESHDGTWWVMWWVTWWVTWWVIWWVTWWVIWWNTWWVMWWVTLWVTSAPCPYLQVSDESASDCGHALEWCSSWSQNSSTRKRKDEVQLKRRDSWLLMKAQKTHTLPNYVKTHAPDNGEDIFYIIWELMFFQSPHFCFQGGMEGG